MQDIFDKMRSLATASFPLLPELVASPSPGEKLAALSILECFANVNYLQFLVSTIEKEKPFVGYHAALALQFAVSALDAVHHDQLREALNAAIVALAKGRVRPRFRPA
jgi:hypothetical protein